MTSPVHAIASDVRAIDALQMAEKLGFHHFPLVEHERLIGLVCTCDLDDVELNAPVKSAIRREPVAVDSSASLADVAARMASEVVGSVLVVEDHRAVGIVTREDLVRAGLDSSSPHFHCDSCGAITHLQRNGKKGVLCQDCRLRATPVTGRESGIGDETGVGD